MGMILLLHNDILIEYNWWSKPVLTKEKMPYIMDGSSSRGVPSASSHTRWSTSRLILYQNLQGTSGEILPLCQPTAYTSET
jgi:hypothetical protein